MRFNAVDVAALIVHAVDAPSRQPSWTQRLAEGARQAGKDIDDIDVLDWPAVADTVSDEFDPGPSLLFVHDQGLYLMSNGHPNLPDQNRTVYADGFSPHTVPFEEWWEAARDLVGGDDFVEALPVQGHLVDDARTVLAAAHYGQNVGPFTLTITDTDISYGFNLT